MRRPSRLRACFCGAALSLGPLGSSAWAHGGLPRSNHVFVEPGNPKDILIESDYWGLFRSTDGAGTWQYACSGLYGGDFKQPTRRSTVLLEGGRVLVATYSGVRLTDDYCNWRSADALHGHYVADLVSTGAELHALTVDAADAGAATRIWHSTDRGDTWTVLGASLPPDFAGTSMRVAPSEPTRVYVGGERVGSLNPQIAASADGGATWAVHEIGPATSDSFVTQLEGVHPARPDVLFARIDEAPVPPHTNGPDEIWSSADGGATWSEVYASDKDDLPSFAFSPDGTSVILGGPRDSIFGGTVTEVLATGRAALDPVFTDAIWGVVWTTAGLYAGTNNFTGDPHAFNLGFLPGFDLTKAPYELSSFQPLMNICQPILARCARDSSVETTCHPAWSDPGGYQTDYLETNLCESAPDGGADGGAAKESSSKGSGCACGVARSSELDGTQTATGLGLGLCGVTRRRRRRSAAKIAC